MSLIGIIASSKVSAVAPSTVEYLVIAGGGGGGSGNDSGEGSSGGGAGSRGSSGSGTSGTVNTGGGGGARSSSTGANVIGGNGGSGVVIIAYDSTKKDLTVGAGLTYSSTTSGGNKIYTFTAGTGTVNW